MAMVIGMSLIGLAYGPLGTVLSELFPTPVRYTGSSLTFNLAGNFRRVADALRRNMAGHHLRAAGGRLLSLGVHGPCAHRAGPGARNKGQAALILHCV